MNYRRALALTILYISLAAIFLIATGWVWYQRAVNPMAETPITSKTGQPAFPVKNNKALATLLKNERFSGTAIVVRRGKVVLNQAFGYANRDKGIQNTTTDRFYIGSAQKSIIATAVLQLEQAGKLSTDDPVSSYISTFPSGDDITLQNLLNHTSGLEERHEGSGSITPQELVRDIMATNPEPDVGVWNYSDSNYAVLSYIIQIVTQEKLADYVQENIFTPAGMDNSGFASDNHSVKHLVNNYRTKNGKLYQPSLPNMTQLFGSGDIYTNAVDMYRFDKALMTDKLINKTERSKMLEPGSHSTYGMGFYVSPGSYSSHGVLGGFDTINTFTHTGLTYIVLITNTDQVTSLGKLSDKIYQHLSDQES